MTLLLVSSDPEDRRQLESLPERDSLLCVEGARRVAGILAQASVVVCDSEVRDPDWRTLLSMALRADPPPAVIVISRQADDRLWAEVLNLGGFDLLAKPLDAGELMRVIEMAMRASPLAMAAG